jgi:glutamate synthase domain-containing protein 2
MHSTRPASYVLAIAVGAALALATARWPVAGWLLLPWAALVGLLLHDVLQERSNILRNFPVIGHVEAIVLANRHIVNQWIIESPREGRPFNEVQRKLVARRAEGEPDTTPFGSELDRDAPGATWLLHSAMPVEAGKDLRIRYGGPQCRQPYEASRLNVSGMSFGSISSVAIRALCGGARIGHFAVNTGEGGLSTHHTEPGADLIFQFGTGYFGCRTDDGRFSEEKFTAIARHPLVKMVEVKISQGAKPGFGAILPAKKNTPAIAEIRGIPAGTMIHSPPAHTAFDTPRALLAWLDRLRHLAEGKPVGFKLCLGQEHEMAAIALAIQESGIFPDFIAIDGAEGGSGAASPDAIHWVGQPLEGALALTHDLLVGLGLRDRIRLVASGMMISSFDVVRLLALGADGVYSARAMMLALGCAQALRCDTNLCPTGITTSDPRLTAGLVVRDKAQSVARFHQATLHGVAELLGAAGLAAPAELTRAHIARRVAVDRVATYAELWPPVAPGSLLGPGGPARHAALLARADPDSFRPRL